MRKKWTGCIFVLCCLLVASMAFGGDKYHIVTNQLPPLKFDDHGVASGITVDIFKEIMQQVGDPIVAADIQSVPWARAYEDVKTLPNTIILSMARTPTRETWFKWVGPVYFIQLGLIGRKHKGFSIDKASDAAQFTVGALRDTAPAQLLIKQGFPEQKIHYLAKTEQALLMLKEGRIDLFAHTADSTFYMMPSMGMDPKKYEVYYVIQQEIPLYIGLNRNFSDAFVARMQKALDALKAPRQGGMSRYDEIVHKYVPDRTFLSKPMQ